MLSFDSFFTKWFKQNTKSKTATTVYFTSVVLFCVAKFMELFFSVYLFLGIIGCIIVAFGLYLWLYPIKFAHIVFGPSIFIYTYHVGSFMKLGETIDSFQKLFEQRNAKQLLSHKLKIPINELILINAGLYFDDPQVKR